MKITVDVNIKATSELTNAILSLATAMTGFNPVPVTINTSEPIQIEEGPAKSEFSFPLQDATTETAEIQVETNQEPETEPDPSAAEAETETDPEPETEPAPVYTLEQVRAKLAALSQAGKQAQVKKLITDCGVNKLTDIPVGNYANLMAAAEEI